MAGTGGLVREGELLAILDEPDAAHQSDAAIGNISAEDGVLQQVGRLQRAVPHLLAQHQEAGGKAALLAPEPDLH